MIPSDAPGTARDRREARKGKSRKRPKEISSDEPDEWIHGSSGRGRRPVERRDFGWIVTVAAGIVIGVILRGLYGLVAGGDERRARLRSSGSLVDLGILGLLRGWVCGRTLGGRPRWVV